MSKAQSLLRQARRLGASQLVRNAGWLTFGQGAGLVLQAAYFVMLARLLGPLQYGIFAGAFAFTGLVAQYSALGMGTVFLRYVSGNHRAFAIYWGNVLLVTLVIGGGLTVALHFLGRSLLNPSSASLVLMAAVANCLCAQLTAESSRVFQAFEQMRITAVLNLLTNLVRTAAAAGMLMTMRRATAWQWSIAAMLVSMFAAGMAIVTISVRFGRPRFVPRLFAKRGMEGFGYSFAMSTSSIYNDIDKSMMSHYGMNVANGVYSMAYRVIDVATVPLFAIREAALPRTFQLGRNGLEASAGFSIHLLKRTFPIAVLSSIVLFIAAPVVPHLLGAGFADGISAIRWLCLIPVFRSVHHMFGAALTGAGLQAYRTGAQAGAAVLNFVLNLWLIPAYGWYGAAWSSLGTDCALSIACWLLVQRFRQKTRIA